MAIHPYFSAFFAEGNNFCDFLFASQDDKKLPKKGSILTGKNYVSKKCLVKREMKILKWQSSFPR